MQEFTHDRPEGSPFPSSASSSTLHSSPTYVPPLPSVTPSHHFALAGHAQFTRKNITGTLEQIFPHPFLTCNTHLWRYSSQHCVVLHCWFLRLLLLKHCHRKFVECNETIYHQRMYLHVCLCCTVGSCQTYTLTRGAIGSSGTAVTSGSGEQVCAVWCYSEWNWATFRFPVSLSPN